MFVLSACEVPYGILGKDEMATILADIHLTEATVGQKYAYSAHETKCAYFESVFEKHGITREEFNASLDWYARHPKAFVSVYDDALEQLKNKRIAVEDYVYHPEANPALRHAIDSIDIWMRPMRVLATHEQHDSLYFEISDTTFFAADDNYMWEFRQRADSNFVADAYLKFFVDFGNGLLDSVVYKLADSVATYQYRVHYDVHETTPVRRIFGYFYTVAIDSFPDVRVDSIRLWRYYNSEKYTLDSAYVARMDSLRALTHHDDSVKVEKKPVIKPLEQIKLNRPTPANRRMMMKQIHEKSSGK